PRGDRDDLGRPPPAAHRRRLRPATLLFGGCDDRAGRRPGRGARDRGHRVWRAEAAVAARSTAAGQGPRPAHRRGHPPGPGQSRRARHGDGVIRVIQLVRGIMTYRSFMNKLSREVAGVCYQWFMRFRRGALAMTLATALVLAGCSDDEPPKG